MREKAGVHANVAEAPPLDEPRERRPHTVALPQYLRERAWFPAGSDAPRSSGAMARRARFERLLASKCGR
jgi:hypothetical protein